MIRGRQARGLRGAWGRCEEGAGAVLAEATPRTLALAAPPRVDGDTPMEGSPWDAALAALPMLGLIR